MRIGAIAAVMAALLAQSVPLWTERSVTTAAPLNIVVMADDVAVPLIRQSRDWLAGQDSIDVS